MGAPKSGPLTRDELLGVWKAAVDAGYRDPLLAAGDGHGLEVIGQMLEQMARASTGIDVTMQSMFILPWSGQSNPPAAGEANATVTLTFRRTGLVNRPLRLAKGTIFVEEQTTDWGDSAGEVVLTGRTYALVDDLVFHPGDVGPFDVVAVATRPGTGYDNPLPGTLKFIDQPGAAFTNDLATVTTVAQPVAGAFPSYSAAIVSAPQADMFVPEHVGQQVLFIAGANAGKIGRIATFAAPTPPTAGSTVGIEILHSFEAATFVGAFQPGELILFNNGGPKVGVGTVVGSRVVNGHERVSYVLTSGTEGLNAVGNISGATATGLMAAFRQLYTAEAATAEWRILDWVSDWGLTVTNVLSPTGGRLAMLDALGRERMIDRAPGESDASYRSRVKQIADVVSPNAVRRALYRVLGTVPFCFREVGMPELPGFYYDGDNQVAGTHGTTNAAALCDAYDTDVVLFTGALSSGVFQFQERVQLETTAGSLLKVGGYFGRLSGGLLTLIRKTGKPPASMAGLRVRGLTSGAIYVPAAVVATPTVDARRFRETFDYVQFRAFFLVGLPPSNAGEFGFAYDSFPVGAYDTSGPWHAFYDGYPAGADALAAKVYQAVDTVKAAGVSFEVYQERIGCP